MVGDLPAAGRPLRLTAYVAVGLVLVAGRCRSVAGVVLVRRPFPQTDGELELAGPRRRGRRSSATSTASRSSTPTRIARPVAGAGLRARPGPVLRDGRPPPRHRRPALRALRRGRPRDRRVRAHARLAPRSPSRSWRCSSPRPAPRSRRTPTASTPTSTTRARREISARVHRARARRPRLRAGAVDAVDSLAWLKAMAWDLRGNMTTRSSGRWPLADHTPERGGRALPAYPLRRHPPIVDQGAVVDGVFEQDATRRGTRLPAAAGVRSRPTRCERCAGCATGSTRLPALLGRGDGIGCNGWVVDGEHTATGAAAARQRPAPRHLHARASGCRSGCTAARSPPTARSTSPASRFSGVPGVVIGHNADIAWGFTNLGPDVTDLYLERVDGDRWLHDGAAAAADDPRGDDRGPRRRRRRAHGPLHRARAAAVRRRRRLRRRSASNAGDERRRPPRTGDASYAVVAGRGPRSSRRRRPTRSSASTWRRLGRVPRAARRLRGARRRTSCTPTARATSATRRPGRIPIRKSGNDGCCPPRAGVPRTTGPASTSRSTALPNVLDPDEGFVVTANQAVIGAATTPTSSPTTGTAATAPADPRPARGRRASSRSTTWPSSSSTTGNPMAPALVPLPARAVDLPGGYYSRRPAAARRLGLPPGRRQRGRRRTTTSVWRNLLGADLPRRAAARTCWPDGGERWFAV